MLLLFKGICVFPFLRGSICIYTYIDIVYIYIYKCILYIYIYIHQSILLSLSLSLNVYTYVYIYIHIQYATIYRWNNYPKVLEWPVRPRANLSTITIADNSHDYLQYTQYNADCYWSTMSVPCLLVQNHHIFSSRLSYSSKSFLHETVSTQSRRNPGDPTRKYGVRQCFCTCCAFA